VRDQHSDLGNAPWVDEAGKVDYQLKEIYQRYGVREIDCPHKKGKISMTFNFHLSDGVLNHKKLTDQATEIYDLQSTSFKVNLGLGVVLRHVDGTLRYWYPGANDLLLKKPFLISNRADLLRFIKRLKTLKMALHAWRNRPSSGWTVYRMVNIRYFVTKTSFALGAGQLLPDYITMNRAVVGLSKDPHRNELYDDNLCAFRCLAYHQTKRLTALNTLTEEYAETWRRAGKNPQSGVQTDQIPEFEDTFNVNVNLFNINEGGNVENVYKSHKAFEQTLNLNLFQKHLSYITNILMSWIYN
jgi:hypothetical protein